MISSFNLLSIPFQKKCSLLYAESEDIFQKNKVSVLALMSFSVIATLFASRSYLNEKYSKFVQRAAAKRLLNQPIPSDGKEQRDLYKRISGLEISEVPKDMRSNYITSQLIYITMCYRGEGGEIDLNNARIFSKKVAEIEVGEVPQEAKGIYIRAQFNYAFMCQHGEGGKVDLGEAKIYYKKIAELKKEKLSKLLKKIVRASQNSLSALNTTI
jgi:TPR repeat protein